MRIIRTFRINEVPTVYRCIAPYAFIRDSVTSLKF